MSEYVDRIETDKMQCGLLDRVFLKDGHCLEISDKSILLCEGQEDSDKQQQDRQSIDITDQLEHSTTDTWNYIEKVDMWDTGGGTLVDILRLKGERFIGISDEFVILFKNEESFYDADYDDSQIISL